MFSLLRRSSRKKKKSYPERSPKAARYSAAAAEYGGKGEHKEYSTRPIERYRSYNEWQRDRDHARENARKLDTERQIGLPTTQKSKKYRRAEIKEDDDELEDLEENENDYCDGDDDARSDESGLANAGRKPLLGHGGRIARADRCIYFRRQGTNGGERDRQVGGKLNLAITTAANNTKSSNAADADTNTNTDIDTKTKANKQNADEGERGGRAGRIVEASGNIAPPALPTVPTTYRNGDFILNDTDAEKINKYSLEPNKLDVNDDGYTDDGYEREREEGDHDRLVRSATVPNQTDCRDCEKLYRESSPNEVVGWQRRFLSFTKTKKSNYKKNKNDRFAKSDRSIIDLEQQCSSATGAKNVASAARVCASNKNINRNGKGDNNNDKCKINAFYSNENEQIAIATQEEGQHNQHYYNGNGAPPINEVKLRNLDNSNKNYKNTNTGTKVQKNSEAKRQSRLSLTLGLNLTGARSKSITDITKLNKTDSSNSVAGYFSGSRSYTSGGSGQRGQEKRSSQFGIGKAFRNSFFRGRSKSSDTEIPPPLVNDNDDREKLIDKGDVRGSDRSGGNKAFKKSKEFLSDLFMARGRNHNRSRSSQTHTTQNLQKTPTQQQQNQQLNQKEQQQKLAQAQQAKKQQQQRQGQQQQQQVQQQQQQYPQQSTKDVAHTFTPVSASTNVNNITTPPLHHNLQDKQQQQDRSQKLFQNIAGKQTNPVTVMQNVQNNLASSTHRDVRNSAAVPLRTSPPNTNYQKITMSNNSSKKNVSRMGDSEEQPHPRRSNSAGRVNSAGAQQLSVSGGAPLADVNQRSRSAEPQWSMSDAGAITRNESEVAMIEEDTDERSLREAGNSKCGIIRERSVEVNGSLKAASSTGCVTREACIANEPRNNNTSEISNNNKNETENVISEECVLEEEEKEKEEEKEEKVKEEEKECIYKSGDNNSEIASVQCKSNVAVCSNASEAPHCAFTITSTVTTPHSEAHYFSSPSPVGPYVVAEMGQTNTKPNETTPNSRANTPREFHESPAYASASSSNEHDKSTSGPINVPKITVVDCGSGSTRSANQNASTPMGSPDVFYDFENEASTSHQHSIGSVQISDVGEDSEEDDEVFHEQEIPATIYQQHNKWPLRYNPTKLENVQEEENEEERDEDNDGAAAVAVAAAAAAAAATTTDSESDSTDGIESDADSGADLAEAVDVKATATGTATPTSTKINSANNLDNEFHGGQQQHYDQHYDSPDRSALKSANTSDSNLSTSYPVSGISGMDSRCSSTSSPSRRHSSSDNEQTRTARSNKSGSPTMQQYYNSNNSYASQQRQAYLGLPHQRSPFARDGNSTDCDDTLMQCDDLEYAADEDPNERLVCIESISLPDVVVESTTGASGANISSASSASAASASASAAAASSGGNGNADGSEQIININGATGNTIGNVHFIPIHVEGSDQAPKRRSIDDSVLGSGGGINKSFAHMNGMHQKSTIEITEDGSELTYGKENGHNNSNNNNNSRSNDATVEKLSNSVAGYFSGSRSYTSGGSGQRGQEKRSSQFGIGKAFRNSFFRGRSKSSDTEIPPPLVNDNDDREKLIDKGDVRGSDRSGGNKAFKKSKEFLSDLFMARGRNHNRSRSSQTHTTQNLQKTPTQQQQNQQLNQKEQQQKLAQAQQAKKQQQQRQGQQQQQQVQQQQQQYPQQSTKDVAHTFTPVSASTNVNNITTPPLHHNLQDKQQQQDRSQKLFQNIAGKQTNPVTVMQNVQNNLASSTHRDVRNSAAVPLRTSPPNTNYQKITMSNNSSKKNVSRMGDSEEQPHPRRSNSAGRVNSAGAQQLSVSGGAPLADVNQRSRSAEPQWSMSDAGAITRNESEVAMIEEDTDERSLREAGNSKCGIIRERSVEVNGSLKAASSTGCVTREACIANEPRNNNTSEISNNNKNETENVISEECVLEEEEKEKEEEKEEKVKEEEKECIYKSGDNNSEIASVQCKSNVAVCSNASEAPHCAFTITSTVTTPHSEAHYFSSPSPVGPYVVAEMGQTNTKPNETTPNSRANTPREFHESPAYASASSSNEHDKSTSGPINVPKITVVDCGSGSTRSANQNASTPMGSPDVFYDFENEASTSHQHSIGSVQISDVGEDSEEDDEVFHEQEIPATIYQQHNKWPLRYNPTKLENVQEEENEEERDEDNDGAAAVAVAAAAAAAAATTTDSESDSTDGIESDADSGADLAEAVDVKATATGTATPTSTKINSANNLDNEFHGGQQQHYDQHYDSPDRSALKSANTSDSNLSTSYPDSGISGMDSRCSSTSSPSRRHSSSDNEQTRTARSNKSGSPTMQQYYNSNNSYASQQRQAYLGLPHQRSPFARDGNSTDCDDTLMQCDDLEYAADEDPNERLVCIESISLPDVVVESTTGASGANISSASSASAASASASAAAASSGGNGNADGSEQIININGATGNTIGNVHFIPIHVEGSDQAPKRRSIDDSVLGSGGGINKSFAHMNGMHQKSTIEITEDGSELTYGKENGHNNSNNNNNSRSNDATVEKLRRELIEQKSRYNTQIGDAQKNVQNLQEKVAGMQGKIEKMEQELSAKAWHVERLQSELQAAQTDDDFVRKRLKLLEEEKTSLRHKYSENEDEFRRKYEELETQYNELEAKYQETKQLASNLQTQLATAQSEAEEWRKEVEKIRGELEAQITILKNALENSEAERKICQDKWQKEFEMLRTQNRDREDSLMSDCEWQLRKIQKQAKEKNDELERERQLAVARAENLHSELEERKQEVEGLKVYQAEVKSLRGVVAEQEQAIKTLMQQIDNIRGELQTANTNLEEQMKAVHKIKKQCDNALCDKEREVVYRINEVRHQAAVFWEDKLYTEMTRLKTELESVYVDERREALDKLQAEHIEELRALTTRYTANEDELRVELNELQERFDRKSEEFIDLRDKSDNNLLQMRMHLDRADREYQNAMCREEERRETLEENLRKEFQAEREEMEEKFRDRLNQVKEEFAKELQDATQEIRQQYEKDLEAQKAKLQAEKEEALQELAERHRKKLAAVEEKIKDIEVRHQHDLKDLKAAYDTEKLAMDRRDISNTNEIEQLHRKCRCLTNLFEEMRMRYERRDPRQEDLREIEELRSRCESQERDLYDLTDRLREMQIQMQAMQTANGDTSNKKLAKTVKKPPPKTIPTNCDVIYEDENEERESPPPPQRRTNNADDDDDDDEESEEQEESGKETKTQNGGKGEVEELKVAKKQTAIINGNAKTANFIISSKKHNNKLKNIDTINEDDESHMITAM